MAHHTYTLTLAYNDNPGDAMEVDCMSAAAAIHEARSFLAGFVAEHPLDVREATVSVSDGSLFSDDADWLGSWTWSSGRPLAWSSRGSA